MSRPITEQTYVRATCPKCTNIFNQECTETHPSDVAHGVALKVEDIYLPLNHLFTQASKKALSIQIKDLAPVRYAFGLIPENPEFGKIQDEVQFFGAKASGERSIFDAAKSVANQINDLATRGFVTGALSKLILVPLHTQAHELETWMVLSYVAISPEGIKYLRETGYYKPAKDAHELVGDLPVVCTK